MINAWNTNVTTAVQLIGGTVSGGIITNDAVSGIIGHGLLAARVINNTQLSAGSGGTLWRLNSHRNLLPTGFLDGHVEMIRREEMSNPGRCQGT